MIIEIPGIPVGKKRPQFTNLFGRCNHCKKTTILKRGACPTCGGYLVPMPRAHKDKEEETLEGKWVLMARQQVQEPPLEGPVYLVAEFFMPCTKSMPKKLLYFIANGGILLHEKKPDLDNLLKFAKDCLKGLAWKDDSQVGVVLAWKYYAVQPRTVLLIEDGNTYNLGDFRPLIERLQAGLPGQKEGPWKQGLLGI